MPDWNGDDRGPHWLALLILTIAAIIILIVGLKWG